MNVTYISASGSPIALSIFEYDYTTGIHIPDDVVAANDEPQPPQPEAA